jgi:hypothetical protein
MPKTRPDPHPPLPPLALVALDPPSRNTPTAHAPTQLDPAPAEP